MAQIIREGTGIILAGGKSSRFGTDKAQYPWRNRPMIEAVVAALRRVFPRIMIVAKRPDRLRFLKAADVEFVQDRFRATHALGGLYSSLRRMRTEHGFVCACDMPLLKPELIRSLWRLRLGSMAVAPRFGGFLQPLCAVYARDCRSPVLKLIRSGRLSMRHMLERIDARVLDEAAVRKVDRQGLSLLDIDTRRDFLRARAACARRAGKGGKRT